MDSEGTDFKLLSILMPSGDMDEDQYAEFEKTVAEAVKLHDPMFINFISQEQNTEVERADTDSADRMILRSRKRKIEAGEADANLENNTVPKRRKRKVEVVEQDTTMEDSMVPEPSKVKSEVEESAANLGTRRSLRPRKRVAYYQMKVVGS